MTSPLLPYANALLLIGVDGVPSISGGRVVVSTGSWRVVECYLKRQDSTGTNTGADYVLGDTQANLRTGSAGGRAYLYRGYALRYASLTTEPNFGTLDKSTLSFVDVNPVQGESWLINGSSGLHRQGIEKPAYFVFESIGGRFGGGGIDEIIGDSIQGLPIVINSGQVLN